ncbi:unnamed protein product [Rotaria sp. Silwood1]|nr:unnamed protein product [Rotaria sp. Silwood1]
MYCYDNFSHSYDSYALYRSLHLNATAKFECKDVPEGETPPTCTIFASTLRFCESVKNTMMSITRPTRRGRLFLSPGETVVPPRKPLLSRHYQTAELQLILPQFRVKYLTSFARQTGAQVDCRLFNFITYQELHLIDHHDGLSRRARILWKPKMMNVNLERAQMWLLRDANEDKEINEISNKSDNKQEPQQQRTFFLSLDSLVYIRSPSTNSKTSTHSVLIDGLKAVWNLKNRRTLFLVYERYRRNNILRSNLSNPFAKELEHLQQEKNANTPSNPSPSDDNITINDELNSTIPAAAAASTTTSVTVTTNGTTSQPSTLASFLDQLINESQHKPSVDLDPVLGLRQCTKDDVEEHTLHIELGDGQIALRGIESRGYVILSAGIALVDQYRHKPVWRDQQLCDKTSWHGNLQGMQYFATTVSSTSTLSTIDNTNNALLSSDDDIIWIPQRDIRDENSLLGESSRSVIGSIATNDGYGDQQLQCIVSKSNANLSYVFYTEQTQQEEETDTNLVIPPFIKPSINESNPIGESDRLLVDSLTFIHNDIQLSTNSSQYRTIMQIVNHFLLYLEPKEEGTNSKLRKLRLQIQLADNLPVLRDSIRHLLERVRSTLANLRRLEREIYFLSRANTNLVNSYSSDEEDGGGGGVRDHTLSYTSEENEKLQTLYTSVKVQLNKLAEKLGMMCAVYKDMQLARLIKLRIAATSNKTARLERRYELHGGSITWFIKHEDGQITNAEFLLRNILNHERNHTNDELQNLRREYQATIDRYRDVDGKIFELTRRNDELKSQISIYEKRFHDNEDNDKRYQNEITTLKRDIQDILRENEEWKRNYEIIKADLDSVQYENEKIISNYQTVNHENIQLKRDINDLTVRIRLQVQQEYEEEYRQLNSRRETEIQTVRKEQEAIQNDLDQMRAERTRLADRLQTVEYNLKQANETIQVCIINMSYTNQSFRFFFLSQSYTSDIDRLNKALKLSEGKNGELERELSRSYTEELKTKTDRIHDLENKCQSLEKQLNQYEQIIHDLRQDKTKLVESYDRLQREYEQQNSHVSPQTNLTTVEERVGKEVVQTNENKQELIDILEQKLREKDHIIQKLQHARSSFDGKDLQLDLEIEIEHFPQNLDTEEHFIRTFTEASPGRDQKFEKILDNTRQDNTSVIGTFREQYLVRDQRSEETLNERTRNINEYERRISELQTTIRDREREILNINAKLQQIEQTFNTQQHELDICQQRLDISNVDLNIAIEENETHLDRIRTLEKQLEMSQMRNITSEQIAQYQTMIDDLKARLRNHEDTIQTLQRTISDSDRTLRETRQNHQSIQSDYNRTQLRHEQMENQFKGDLENRDQTIASLRKKLIDKDQEIDKLRQSDIAKEALISKLRSKSRESDQDSRSEYSGARAPTNVALRLEIQKKDDQIDELKRQLDRTRRDISSSGRDDSSTVQHAQRVVVHHRPRLTNFDHLNREELLYELEMALQDNEGLVQQLAKKTPNITELHNQLLDLRKELARQKYVNQVLWRKLDALIDIQGSNTRAELALELANYHDELEALKAKQHRANDTRLAMLNASSRSSSGVCLSHSLFLLNNDVLLSNTELPSNDIQSKIEILKHSNLEWQERFAHLKEKYYQCERQSRHYYRKLMKSIKLLYDAGLIDSSSIRQRRHSADDPDRKLSTFMNMIIANEKIDNSHDIKNIEELQEIIRNQKKYIEQLQIRVRINTPDIIQSGTLQQLTEQNKISPENRTEFRQSAYSFFYDMKTLLVFFFLKKTHETELNQYRLKSEKTHTDLVDDLNVKQNDLRQARLQVELLKSTKTQLEQAQDQNQRLQAEIKLLQNEIMNKKALIDHYEKQISLLEKQISSRDGGKGEMTIRTSEMSELLEEMRRLRHDLERSIHKQNELQAKLDENIRLTKAAREFSFSGRGVSYPDLRIIDGTSSIGAEHISLVSMMDEKRSRPLGSSTTELATEQINLGKKYIVGELEDHENLRRLIANIRIELKALEVKLKEKLRSKHTTSMTDPSIEWLEHRLNSLNQCLTSLEETYRLMESYWPAYLPNKNRYNEHQFNDPRLVNENKELRISQSNYMQELQNLKQKYKEQSAHVEQLLTQLTVKRFLNGEDSNIDYTSIDNNENLDDIKIRERDEEEKYFDDEDPYSYTNGEQ